MVNSCRRQEVKSTRRCHLLQLPEVVKSDVFAVTDFSLQLLHALYKSGLEFKDFYSLGVAIKIYEYFVDTSRRIRQV